MAALKSCPFCGREATVEDQRNAWVVDCRNHECPAIAEVICQSREEAIEAWNRRAVVGAIQGPEMAPVEDPNRWGGGRTYGPCGASPPDDPPPGMDTSIDAAGRMWLWRNGKWDVLP